MHIDTADSGERAVIKGLDTRQPRCDAADYEDG
jgi:hypothetical protein